MRFLEIETRLKNSYEMKRKRSSNADKTPYDHKPIVRMQKPFATSNRHGGDEKRTTNEVPSIDNREHTNTHTNTRPRLHTPQARDDLLKAIYRI